MTKQTPGWGQGDKTNKQVEPAAAKGHPVRQTPHFVPVSPPGAPKAGVKQPFARDKGPAK